MKPAAVTIGAAAIFFSVSAVGQSLPDAAQDAVKKVTGGITNVFGSIFNPVESNFKSAVREKRFLEAFVLYEKNGQQLNSNKELEPDILVVLEEARKQWGPDFDEKIGVLAEMRERKAYRDSLERYLAAIKDVDDGLSRYVGGWHILRDYQDKDARVARAKSEATLARTELQADLAETYRRFPHEKLTFSVVYGQPIDESILFQGAWPALSERMGGLTEEDARALVRHTSGAWSNTPALREQVSNAVLHRLDPTQSTLGRARASSSLDQYGLSRSDAKEVPAIFVLDNVPNAELPLKVSSPFDKAVVLEQDVIGASGSQAVIIVVEENSSKRNIVDKKEVTSNYRSGTRSAPNPSYAIAQMDCQTAQSQLAAQQTRDTLVPARGWGAVLQGINQGLIGANVKVICDRFAATSPTVEEDVMTPYTFTVTEVEVSKAVKGRIVARDASQSLLESCPFSIEDKKRVKVAYGKKDGDRAASDAISDSDLEALAGKPLEMSPEILIQTSQPSTATRHAPGELHALLDKATTLPGRPLIAGGGTLASVSTASVTQTNATFHIDQASLDSRMQSVVVVLNPKGSLGAGFYVDSNNILTNYHVVEGATTIELRGLDGQLFTGRVVKKDIGIDLALIQVDHPGEPVKFANFVVKTGETVEAIGHPKGLFFSVSRGVVSAVRQMKGMLAPGSDKALVIQTDASINPGNSGGPLYIRDQVVGVNTVKFKGAEGIGFAIHYSEVMRFLSQ